jgi:putative transposase
MVRWSFLNHHVSWSLTVPNTTLLDIPQAEQEQMLAALRQARYGYLLALHVLLLCAAGRTPTEIATVLFCSRSSVYRLVRLYHAEQLGLTVDADGQLAAPVRTTILRPWLKRSLGALLKAPPRASGWCRTRWSCATLALELHTKHGLEVSAWTVRHWLHDLGWVWKRAQLVAKDNDPQRVERLARIRWQLEHLQAHEMLVFADELDIHLLPKVGAAWMLKGSQEEVMTPGQNEKHYLAGALDLATGKILHCLGSRKTNALFRDLLTLLERTYAQRPVSRIYVVVDNYRIHKAHAVGQWLATHPRFELLWLPTYCPRANPIERAFGDVHDKCTRNHKRKRLRDVVDDVERHLQANGPWLYKLSRIYQEPEVTAAVERIAAEAQPKRAA